jgi:site-specific DNA-methyltransferase (cytosine-N4-specific)
MPVYSSELGAAYCGDSLQLLPRLPDNSVSLVLTSPPFALQREKEYLNRSGNKSQEDYVEWLARFGELVFRKLRADGSFVLDIGGAYVKGAPERALYPFRVLLKLCDALGFKLAQDFYWNNPAKLPSPIEWVNKRKLRAKDSVNTVWWFSKTQWPKADVSRVLVPYSDRMKQLIKNPGAFYKPAKRPSGHDIAEGFGRDNGGAIPSNLLQIPNTESNGRYLDACKLVGAQQHPARFPAKLPEFFIRLLTDPGDLVVDIFAGSNTTGAVAETERRRWAAFDLSLEYMAGSAFRFVDSDTSPAAMKDAYDAMLRGETLDLKQFIRQGVLLEPQAHYAPSRRLAKRC